MYHTTAAYVSGAICGAMWWPVGEKAGKCSNVNLLDIMGPKEGTTFREALNSILMREGGDFNGAAFTADTVVRIERRQQNPQGYTVHVWEREVSALPDCADLVDPDSYVSDFMGEE